MTGSAKIAWFIAAVLFSSAMLGEQAQCAAPKDALKYLRITHTSNFKLTEHDAAIPGYSDGYRGNWTLDWKPPPVGFSKGALGYSLHYTQSFTDNLNRITATSLDSRLDRYKVNLNLLQMKPLTFSYRYDRSDNFQNNKSRRATTIQTTSIGLAPPNFPKLTYGNTNRTEISGLGAVTNSATETNQTFYQAEFRRNAGNFGQEYVFRNTVNSGITGGKSGISQFRGYRQIKIPSLGTLQFNYNFSETNKYKKQGTTKEDFHTNKFVLSYNNGIPGFPLNYNFALDNTNASSPNNDTNTEIKKFNLTYQAPVPEGKQLTVVFAKMMREDRASANSRHTSEDRTNMSWRFRTNPLTDGSINYSQTQNVNIKAGELTKKIETTGGVLNYNIPGKNGRMSGQYNHRSETSLNNRTMTDSVNLNNSFNFGDPARITFTFSQVYSGRDEPRGDTTLSGLNYHFKHGNIILDANWKQRLSRPREFEKDVIQNFGVHFTYLTPAKIRYDFMLNEGNTADTMNLRPNSKNYQSKNEIEFRVTYTF